MPPIKTFGERIADALVEDGLLFRKQVDELMEVQKREGTRLLKIIITPAMVVSWALGLWLAWAGGVYAAGWLHAKVALVLALSALHGFFVRSVRQFALDQNRHSQKFYRIINEVPAVLMVAIVILAVVKPF